MSEKKTKIIAVDNHPVAIKGYKYDIENSENYELIGVAYNGRELIDLLPFKEPDIIILDLEMPVMNGDEALAIVKERYPNIKVLISSTYDSPILLAHFARMGADGYIPKASEDLIKALDHLVTNKFYFDSSISKEIVCDYEQREKLKFLDQLSLDDTEAKILKLICNDKKNREIADQLNMSIHTVDSKRRSIYEKTKVSSLPDLIKYAIKNGIISLD